MKNVPFSDTPESKRDEEARPTPGNMKEQLKRIKESRQRSIQKSSDAKRKKV